MRGSGHRWRVLQSMRQLEDVDVDVCSPSTLSLWLALRCNSDVGEQAQAIGVTEERVRDALDGAAELTDAEQARADAWLAVVWLRHARRCGARVDKDDEARARAEAQALGCEVG